MRGHGGCALFGGHQCGCHEAKAEKQLLQEDAVADADHVLHRAKLGADPFSENIRDTDKTVFLEEREQRHDCSNNGTEDGGQCCTGDAECRETQMTADQQVVEDHVDGAGGQIRAHCDAGLSGAALCGVDSHLNDIEDHAAHDDAEIGNAHILCIGGGAAEADDGIRKDHKNDAHQNTQKSDDDEGCQQDLIGFLLFLFTAAAGNQRGNGNIEGCKHCKADVFGLLRQADCRDSACAQGTDHCGVDDAGQCHEEGLHDGGPCHVQGFGK